MAKRKTKRRIPKLPKKIDIEIGDYRGKIRCSKKKCTIKAKKKGFFEDFFSF